MSKFLTNIAELLLFVAFFLIVLNDVILALDP